MTIRRLMVAVAIAGLIAGIGIEGERRRVRFLAIAENHSWMACAAIALDRPEIMTWHDSMQRKYEHAARYPWLPVALDPPEPE